MRFRLLRRRLTISAPRMAVRSALPWPFRWLVMAIVLGFSAAVALWAFEFGKSIAGLDSTSKEELVHLRAEMAKLREERDQGPVGNANTSGSLLTAESATQEKLTCANSHSSKPRTSPCGMILGFLKNSSPSGGRMVSADPRLAGRGGQATTSCVGRYW
jgi:hypothetical protein